MSKIRKAAKGDLSIENNKRRKNRRKKSTKQKTLDRKLTIHHIIPSSRKGNSSSQNITMLQNKKHRAYHILFSNMTPDEIIAFLVCKCWNRQWRWIEIALINRKSFMVKSGIMKRPKHADWWRLNKRGSNVDIIEWTSAEDGWVRAKMDSRTPFEYMKVGPACYNPKLIGGKIVERQRSFENKKR